MAPAPPHTWAGVVGEWAAALRRAPQLLATVALRRRSLEDELVAASLRGHLRRALAWWDLLALGVGQAVASGIFTQSGVAANTAGPAVVLSFAFSGAAAAAAAACYAEFAADFPVAGAGLTYTIITLGEAPGEAIEVVPGLRRAPPQPSHQLLRPPPPPPPPHTQLGSRWPTCFATMSWARRRLHVGFLTFSPRCATSPPTFSRWGSAISWPLAPRSR